MTGPGKAEEKRPLLSPGKCGKARHHAESYKVASVTVSSKLCVVGLIIIIHNLDLELGARYFSLD